jgi:uncharacterized repeat protein (TIGR01451 family)
VTILKTASKTTAQIGDTITYTISLAVVSSSVNSVTVMDTLPANMSFVSFISSPPGTVSVYVPSTSLLEWTNPTLALGNYQFTYQTKVDDSFVCGLPIVNLAQLNYQGLATPLTSSVTVKTLACDFTVRVGVYNEAGELVKMVLVELLSEPVNSIDLKATNTITSLHGTGSSIGVYYKGHLIGTWDGTNQANDPVTNGVYHLKVDSVDMNGVVTSVSQQAIVSRTLAKVQVDIYNEAGEIVRHLYEVVDDPKGADMTGVVLNSGVVEPGSSVPGAPTTVQILVQTTGVPVTLVWDGKGDQGSVVTGGHYQIGIHWNDGLGANEDITRAILVVGGGITPGTVFVVPNILNQSIGTTVTTFQINSTNNYTLQASIYTVAGELVAVIAGNTGSNQASWDASGIASGIYIAVVEVRDSNNVLVQRKLLKVLVIR